jgi:hypothetical protein
VSSEDFETATLTSLAAAGWEDATLDVAEGVDNIERFFTRFMGRFGRDLPSPTKTVNLPAGTDSVRVTFKFYEIDSWDGSGVSTTAPDGTVTTIHGPDKFEVKVNDDELVDLGTFPNPNLTSANDEIEGVSGGIQWTVITDGTPIHTLGFGSDIDQKHTVVLDIPISHLSSNTLTLQFIALLSGAIGNESAGIDNLKIISCPLA